MRFGYRSLHRASAVAALGACVALAGCGYALTGRGSFLPSYIQTIGIPLFENRTGVFDAEQLLTTRVRQEFMTRGKYRVVTEASGADAVVRGEISAIVLTPAGFNDTGQATRYSAQIIMRLTLEDVRAGRVIWENPSLVYREEFEVVTAASSGTVLDVSAFFGQGGNALDRMAMEFARSTVTSILESF